MKIKQTTFWINDISFGRRESPLTTAQWSAAVIKFKACQYEENDHDN